MLFSLADAATILAAFERLERIEDSILNIETDMATFKETIIAAFAYAKARIAELEAENSLLASDDLADEEALAAAAEEAAAAKAALAQALALDKAEDAEILEAASAFIKVVEEPVVENL